MTERFLAPQAWLDGAWAQNVLLSVDAAGCWSGLQPGASAAQTQGATRLDGPVLPALVDAHSHAFQRAIAGLTERAGAAGSSDDFWSWRDRMYSVARRITPDQLEHIAAWLYVELLAGGYTQVCEFHYLHQPADAAGGDPLAMSMALVRAADRVGMGLTLLPTLYMRAGFGASDLRDDQRRFAATPDSLVRLVEGVQAACRGLPGVNLGLAIHSLRAAGLPAMQELAAWAGARQLPVHIHIAEQTKEVQDCLAHTGQRPIEWLLDHLPVNAQWNLVHATHASPAELQAVAQRGAAIVICPSTEANLGDGVFDYPAFAAASGNWSIGSDSHVTRSWPQELCLLEYSQRLTLRRRNVAAQVGGSSAAALYEGALAGGQAASGRPLGPIALGKRADFLVLDAQSPALLGIPGAQTLDALVFSSPQVPPSQVYQGGQLRLDGRRLCRPGAEPGLREQLAQDFARTMGELWA
jgi:formimidoylglutamate deiminase